MSGKREIKETKIFLSTILFFLLCICYTTDRNDSRLHFHFVLHNLCFVLDTLK